MRKRTMTPAVNEMTVREERACLSEIREKGNDINYKHRLQNGWTAGDFALKYVTGHYRKRKNKEQTEEVAIPVHARNHKNANEGPTENASHVCNPFLTRPGWLKDNCKQTKRTQRYRSTAKSRVLGMTVGDIRYCFQQLRNENGNLTPEFVLYNGKCSGEFALCYLIETSNSTRNRRRRECHLATEGKEEETDCEYPDTQLPRTSSHSTTYDGRVVFS